MKTLLLTCSLVLLALTAFSQVDWVTQTYEVDQGTHIEGTSRANDMAIDQMNNIYITGLYNGEIRFDTTLLPDDFGHVYLAQYEPDGELGWVRSITGNSNNVGHGVAVNDSNHVYITGEYTQTNSLTILGFGNFDMQGNASSSTYIAKAANDGTFLWATRILSQDTIGTQYARPTDIQVAPNGDVIVIGNMIDPAEIEGTWYNTNPENDNFSMMYIARFRPDGKLAWFRHTNRPSVMGGNITASNLVIGSQGQLYVNGKFGGELIWDTDTLREPDGGGLFIARFDEMGDMEWYQTASSRSANQFPADFGVDAQDNVYLTMRFGGRVYFQDTDFFPTDFDLKGRWLLLKFDAQGNREFFKDFAYGEFATTGGIAETTDLTVHSLPDGTTYLTGMYAGFGDYMVFGGRDTFDMPDPFTEGFNTFIAAYDNNGNYLDVGFFIDEYLTLLDELDYEASTMLFDSDNKLILSGFFTGMYRIDTDTLSTETALDNMFILKVDPDQMFDFNTSIDKEKVVLASMQVYPNPAAEWVHIQLETEAPFRQTIAHLYTLNGVRVRSERLTEAGLKWNISGLSTGTYVVMVQQKGVMVGKKLIIQR